ncbi:MAG: MFS transporter [Candidatus Geothermarchaeales archaeon]
MAVTDTTGGYIDRIGFGRFQTRLLFVCGAGWLADAWEVVLVAFIVPGIISEWSLSNGEASLVISSIFIGMLVGAWFWGSISDYLGRRLGFQYTVLIDSVFGLLSAFSPNFLVLALLRGLTGFGVGGTLPVDYSVFAEYLPTKRRGRYLVYLESFWAVGTVVAAGIAFLVTGAVGATPGWRYLLAISAAPGLVIFLIRRYIPESPRYLVLQGRESEAREVLRRVAAENAVDIEVGEITAEEKTTKFTVSALWIGRFVKTTLMLWVAWFTISIGYYGVWTWLPKILAERLQLAPAEFHHAYWYVFLMAFAQLPGYFSAAYLIERIGRKWTLGSYLVASGLFTYLFAQLTGLTSIVSALIMMAFFSLGAWGSLYAYTPELYPTEIRSTGMGWAAGMTRIAGILAPFLPALLTLPLALLVFGGAFVVGGVAVIALGRETMGQALLETAK